jgi:hypothetical protein
VSGQYLAYAFGDTGQGVTFTLPAGYTGDAHNVNGSTNNDIAIGYKDSTGGTETGTWTLGAGSFGNPDPWGLIMAAFKLAGTLSGPNSPGTGTDLGGGTGTWTSPGNITADDGSAATWAVV